VGQFQTEWASPWLAQTEACSLYRNAPCLARYMWTKPCGYRYRRSQYSLPTTWLILIGRERNRGEVSKDTAPRQPAGLTPAGIVDVALALIDRDGLENFSLRHLTKEPVSIRRLSIGTFPAAM
jgi:hypothetical protein